MNRFSWKTDDTLYIKDLWVARIAEYDDISALWCFKTIGELINNEIIRILERRMHRFAINDERLRDKKSDGDDDNDEKDD